MTLTMFGQTFTETDDEVASAVYDPSTGDLFFSVSEFGLLNAVAIDLAGRGITVLPLHPGWVRTDMGGPDAELDVETSVAGLREVIDGVTMNDSGRFLDYLGAEIPW